MIEAGPVALIAGAALLGAAFGAVVQRSNYCMMGAVADYALSGDLARMRGWMLAVAVATLGAQSLHLAGVVDLSQSYYRAASLPWAGIALGGLMFGFGMVIACGCVSRSLVNFAGGDLRALIALVFVGLFGYATMHGLLAYPRVWLASALTLDLGELGLGGQSLGDIAAAVAGTDPHAADAIIALALAIALTTFSLSDPAFRARRRIVVGSVLVGLLVAAGWWVTGVLGADDFDPQPLLSLRFVAPTGDALQYLMTFTGSHIDFGVATVLGVVAGAFAAAMLSGSFRAQAFEDLHDLGRYIIGGALMGTGGVLALGCTVGQGLSGVSTLSAGSFLALACIIAGGVLGVRYLEHGTLIAAMRSAIGRA